MSQGHGSPWPDMSDPGMFAAGNSAEAEQRLPSPHLGHQELVALAVLIILFPSGYAAGTTCCTAQYLVASQSCYRKTFDLN